MKADSEDRIKEACGLHKALGMIEGLGTWHLSKCDKTGRLSPELPILLGSALTVQYHETIGEVRKERRSSEEEDSSDNKRNETKRRSMKKNRHSLTRSENLLAALSPILVRATITHSPSATLPVLHEWKKETSTNETAGSSF